jgi:hypothetical protein
MDSKIIGVIWRFGKNDYQISITDYDEEDEQALLKIDEKYGDRDAYSGLRGDENISIKDANIEYWENDWAKEERLDKQKELATKLYNAGFIKTNALYDYSTDEDDQMSIPRIIDALNDNRSTAYLLETFAQFCDGSQKEEDHKLFFECMMDIIHYMEDYQKGDN